ncbi:uncharacterized protein LOC113346917 [Papaver somniferum]|uniref:uncharacterized protein LOC113346917 n=1 Tax=Papaver somniferum TaxID=3469 RepID=UPI000E6FAABD|nr:uncharacterized protein LOC113346917 [Papaver somniferum]XP_026446255.1 uncharacterized protein LOC113346917 [Papaver somniferum]XP_026446256.1 uncharacterized protein LOC113346917 [Papaver somniferum]
MGFISRKVLPVCSNMCICCPALRSRSRQPVKRYKKLLAEIFPKSLDGPPNERKIVKLCEYAAKNPVRIPKIVKYLEQRIFKELRNEHIKVINIIMEAYNKLLSICKGQMVYFAGSILNVVSELLDDTKKDTVRVLGCHTLTAFIHSQVDNTYNHNIESFVHKICTLARETGEEHEKICLRASSLQCLSAMVWHMAQFSHVFANFDEIVHVTLDNYKADRNVEDDGRGESNHNWVDEVVRCEGRAGAGVSTSVSPSHMTTRPRPEKKDSSLLSREETETPAVWTQICIQKMVELAKESTTMRRVLEPMFIYFDTRKHWEPQHGLAMVVLSDMAYFVENSGNQQLILAAIIRHLDHKNVAYDPQTKSNMIQIATALAQQLRAQAIVPDIGIVSDMCRHLKKSLQASVDFGGQQKPNTSTSLQSAIEDCLLEIARGIDDARPLFDLMAITLEDLPPMGVVGRATIGSMLILAHIISLASVPSYSQKIFPEALLVQLLRTMMHPDAEARIGAHQIFSAILIPSSRSELSMLHSGSQFEARRWQCKTASAFASATALLEKLRKEKDGEKVDKHENGSPDDFRGSETIEEEWKQGWIHKKLPNLFKLNSSIIEKTTGPNVSLDAEPNTIQLSEDQTVQLLSAFWMQASLSDNLPSNFEAIARSFSLTLISSRPKNSIDNIVIRFFQLPLSLKRISLDPNYDMLPPSCQRLLFTLATSMLMFAAKIYQVPNLDNFLTSVACISDDRYLSIGDDLQLCVKPQADLKEFGSTTDHEAASHALFELREALQEADKVILKILVENLSCLTKLDTDDLATQLSEVFTPDDAFLFGPQSILDFDHLQMASLAKESLSFDEEFQANSTVDNDAATESSVHNYSSTMPRTPNNSSLPHIISAGQLIESAFEVAGQVAGSSISTSPLPYSAMARQCEALGTCTRKKLSSWLAHETTPESNSLDNLSLTLHGDSRSALQKVTNNIGSWESIIGSSSTEQQPWSAMKLPPASPFDNFMKAARF